MKKLILFLMLFVFFGQANAQVIPKPKNVVASSVFVNDYIWMNTLSTLNDSSGSAPVIYDESTKRLKQTTWDYIRSLIPSDSMYVSYCSGCTGVSGWKVVGDSIFVDISYLSDSANIVHWSDTTTHIATPYNIDTLASSVYDLINDLDTGKVSTSGDNMYGDLIINANLSLDAPLGAAVDSFLIYDGGIVKSIPLTSNFNLYNKIQILRPNGLDTIIPASSCDLVANTTLFPKGSYFHWYIGDYTTIVNNARDSCIHYFDAGAILTKTTAGAMFDYSAVTNTNDINILGCGTFSKTTNSGAVFYIGTTNTNTLKLNFEFDKITSTSDRGIFIYSTTHTITGSIKGNSITSSAATAIAVATIDNSTDNSKYFDVDIKSIISTASQAAYFTKTKVKLKSDYIYTSIAYPTAYGIYCYDGGMDYDVKWTNSACFDFSNQSLLGYNVFKGYSTYIKAVGYYGTIGVIDIIGQCDQLDNTNAQVEIGYAKYVVSDGAYSYTHVKATQKDAWQQSMSFNATLGRIKYDYFKVNFNYGGGGSVSGGTVTINDAQFQNIAANTSPYFLLLSSGTLICNGRWYIEDAYTGSSFVRKTGGTFISNSGVMVRNSVWQQFVNASASAQDIKVYSVACNGSAGDMLSTKAQKNKITVEYLTQPTSFQLNATGITSTVNTSKADIAADMVSKINLAALGITATQDNAGVDEYFYITADVAGTAFTVLYFTNCTNTNYQLNSYAITDITGGSIIEDTDVSF